VDNRRLFLAFLLSMVVIFAWYSLFPPKPPQRPAQETDAPRERPAPTPSGEAGAPARPAAPRPSPGTPPAQRVEAVQEERVVLAGEGIRAVLTNRGAQLTSLEVPTRTAEGAATLELVRARQEGPWPYGLTVGDLQPHPLNRALFTVRRDPGGRSAAFVYSGPAGRAEKRFRINEQGLLEVEVRVTGPERWGLLIGPGIRNPTAEELKSQFSRRSGVYLGGGEVQLVAAQDAEETVEIPGRGLSWVGLEDNYFLSAVIPREGLDAAVLRPVLIDAPEGRAPRFLPMPPEDQLTDEQKDMGRELALALEPESDRLSLLSYWGSKEFERLAALPYGLERSVNFGFFGFLARPLLAGLHWIYDNIVANYGWAIVLMTVLIRIILLPLTHHSTKSMRKMADLNPKIQAIRERYRTKLKDKQGKPNLEMQRKMNEEVMGLYKEHGVNPAGGCLPILLQMPILFAFYGLLSTAAELRGAPWALWIRDLSVHDPYYVLPIVMGATQFLQVRMAPPGGDPMQRRIFQLMPIFMTFLFLGFPSGLVLYWLTSNILTIAQQWVYNRLMPATT
jgi:YidC/Oxa1 family membrane protein insertase